MSTLNRAWMVQTFLQILTATESGSFVPVNSAYPEIIDLTERKYVKQNKRLHNKDGEVAYVAVKGAKAVDLLNDLGYTAADREELSLIIPSELIDAMTQSQAPAQPQVATTAPVAPQVPAQPAVPTAADAAPVVPAAPTLGGEVLAQSPVVTAATQTVTDTAPAVQQTLSGVETSTIDLDVSFGSAGKPVSKSIDYDALVAAKLQNPASQPSIHIAGKKSKDISVPVKKQAEYYEQHNGITFRVRSVNDTDPKGAGVRIFALTVEEAPERRKFGGAK